MWLLYCVTIISSASHHFSPHKKTLKEERWDRGEVEGRTKKRVEVPSLLVLEKTGFTRAGWTPDNGRLLGRRLDARILLREFRDENGL